MSYPIINIILFFIFLFIYYFILIIELDLDKIYDVILNVIKDKTTLLM
jgi:TM2 domain-containing membrane protein YozV